MALYSLKTTPISRASGKSAVAAAAYRHAAKLDDDRYGVVRDYTRKRGVLHSELVLPESAPSWASDRARLWNAAEARETGHAKQDSARTAREFLLALPCELPFEAQLALTRRFARLLIDTHGAAVDFAIHAPDRRGDDRNFHAHVMMTTRELGPEGFGKKIRAFDGLKSGPAELTELRRIWAGIGAESLEQAGHPLEAARFREAYKTLEVLGVFEDRFSKAPDDAEARLVAEDIEV